MPDANDLDNYYKTLTNNELLNLAREGGFTDEAEQVLRKELARRNLTTGDLKRHIAASERSNLRDEVTERGGGYRSLGLQFFGVDYLNEADRKANIRVRTKWFTMSGIPLIPIASYRFKCTTDSGKWSLRDAQHGVIDRIPLNWGQVFVTWVKVAIVAIGAGLLIVGVAWFLSQGGH